MARDELTQRLTGLLEEVNRALEAHERLQFIAVTGDVWGIENEFLTPTMKLRRARIEERYGVLAGGWYAAGQAVVWA